ncbi:MAG: molybdopterin-synthase adenylyltransferase MoeB [Gemmatimonadota bacterium]|nr:molybdopterin-synthase adenylyltransferase MoeB [Gemmatimonadota bacterium]
MAVPTRSSEPDARDVLPPLDEGEQLRYSRHLLLDEVGVAGQRKIKRARVLLIGAGGLGSPSALYLAAAGVGTIGLVDFDVVDASNLQRQILHGTSDVGRAKVESARDRIRDVNPHVNLEAFETRFDSGNALEIMRDFDIVVDGSDNFATRYLTNDAAVLLGKLNAFACIFRFEGQASVFGAPDGPCYRCVFREPPPAGLVPNCAEAGVLGVLPGLLGTIQAVETLKLILGVGDPLIGRLLLVETLGMTFRTVAIKRDPTCPACGDVAAGGGSIRSLRDREAQYADSTCGAPEGGDNSDYPEAAVRIRTISALELSQQLATGADFDLVDVREPVEWRIARIERARLVPLGTIRHASDDWERDRPIVLYCKAGIRSMTAAQQLVSKGFTNVTNLAGGIVSWTNDVDPSLTRY